MNPDLSKHTLEQALLIIESLIPLLIRSGIGHSELAAACKPLFYRQALIEAQRTNQKTTDSSISLLSGLHRRDTASLRKAIVDDPSLVNPPISKPSSVPKQVISRWLSMDLGDAIPIQGDNNSFAYLVSQVSKDQHFRSIITELERLGIVSIDEDDANIVVLKRNSYTPNPNVKESREQFAQNISDHISSGLYNLFSDPAAGDKGILEQAIFSDELTLNSVQKLDKLANELWFKSIDGILKHAIDLHEQDKSVFKEAPSTDSYRFRLGMYSYNELESNNDTEYATDKDD